MEPGPGDDVSMSPDLASARRWQLLQLVGGGKRVLAVHCSPDQFAVELQRHNVRVVGVEADAEGAAKASKILDDVVVGEDLTALDAGGYDVVLFERGFAHVADPVWTLRSCRHVLAEQGYVVAAVENVAHVDRRLHLLRGTFATTDGETRPRPVGFFTRQSMHDLFREAGLAIVDEHRLVREPSAELADAVPADVLSQVLADPEASTAEFVVRAVRDDAQHAIADLVERLDAAERLGAHPAPLERPVRALAVTSDHRLVHPLTLAVLELEVGRRLGAAVQVRVVDDPSDAFGWGADLLIALDARVDLDRDLVDAGLATDLSSAVASSADDVAGLGALAPRIASRRRLDAERTVLRALGIIPDGPYLVVSASLGDDLGDLVTLGNAAPDRAATSIVLLVDPTSADGRERLESAMPGALVSIRPNDGLRLAAISAGAAGVISSSALERGAARALGVPVSGFGSATSVEEALDQSRAAPRHPITVEETRLEAALDAALAPVQRRFERAAREDPSPDGAPAPSEQELVAAELEELQAVVARRETRIRLLEREIQHTAAIDELLTTQADAIVQLQEALVDRPKAAVVERRAARLRRIEGRLRRLVGR